MSVPQPAEVPVANLIADLHGELRPRIGWAVESGLLVQAYHALAADADWRRPARRAACRAVILTGSAGAAAERLLAATHENTP